MLYDPTDTHGSLVGANLSNVKTKELPEGATLVAGLWSSVPRSPIPPCEDGWRPTDEMIWHGPHSLEPQHAFGPSELEIIQHSGVHILQDTPQSDIQLLAYGCPEERMVTWLDLLRMNSNSDGTLVNLVHEQTSE